MHYKKFSLNGAWELDYQAQKYLGTEDPWKIGVLMENAVPGYWEDMSQALAGCGFPLQINPEYEVQAYPMAATPPDMALPNILGNFFYRRSFFWTGTENPCTLHFGGVQNTVSVWLNGHYLGRYEGYSTPFEVSIPAQLLRSGENTVVLSVSNHPLEGFEGQSISGLTSRAANYCTGGIWGDVELREYTSPLREVAVTVSEDCKTVQVETSVQASLVWQVCDGTQILKEGTADGEFAFSAEGLSLWSPENPKLYTLRVSCGDSSVCKSFGVRRLTADGVQLRLNGRPYYLRGICEHCYFPVTVHPNSDAAFYRSVILKLKELGFNFIRCHTFIPDEAYLQAADELGMLFEVETPNNTTYEQWLNIISFCRRHTSVVMYSGGNELQLHEEYIRHLHRCADAVHAKTDALFSPMSALRGFEYAFEKETGVEDQLVTEPFPHNPRRFAMAESFCDVYNSYTRSQNSYCFLKCDPQLVDSWSSVYGKPRLSHEICISGTFADLSLKSRYEGTRIGQTQLFSSVEAHLKEVGVLENAPLYFQNSCRWQSLIRKYAFETVRMSKTLAGYDFLGPIDTHWHTFGYDVGMMNEFYELKPGETVDRVLMYNSPTVLLTDLGLNVNFLCGTAVKFTVSVSHYGEKDLHNAALRISLLHGDKTVQSQRFFVGDIPCGSVELLADCTLELPETETPQAYRIYATLKDGGMVAENQWDIYAFPEIGEPMLPETVLCLSDTSEPDKITEALQEGKTVVLLGDTPFVSNPTSFQISLAGRTSGHLATVVREHPVFAGFPHEGFCGWQFRQLLEEGSAVCFGDNAMPFDPVLEVVPTHKCFVKQAAMFECRAMGGKLFVCSLNFREEDPVAQWLKNSILHYVCSDGFAPAAEYTPAQFDSLCDAQILRAEANTNFALNPNDRTSDCKRK